MMWLVPKQLHPVTKGMIVQVLWNFDIHLDSWSDKTVWFMMTPTDGTIHESSWISLMNCEEILDKDVLESKRIMAWFIELDDEQIEGNHRKPLYLMVKTMVSG